MNDLSQYIEQQRLAGLVESAGEFTLAIEKARDKLSTYSLANPEDYILKIVQCAVILRVKRLQISLQRNTVLVHFEIPEEEDTLSVENLTRSLVTPLDESNPARSHLALALCSIAGYGPIELMWGDWTREGGVILSLGHNRSELFRDAPFPRTEALNPGQKFHLLYFKKPSSTLPLSQTSAELNTLIKRCAFAPIAIDVNGAELQPRLPVHVPPSDPVSQLTSPYWGAMAVNPGTDERLAWSIPNVHSEKRFFGTKRPQDLYELAPSLPPAFVLSLPENWQLPLRGTLRFSELLGVPVHLYGASQIIYVKDGVMMNPIEVHSAGGGAFAVLDGWGLKTDLSGLQVIEDDKVKADIESATENWVKLVNAFVDGNPPIYKADLLSNTEEAISSALGSFILGPLNRVLRPIFDYLTQRQRKRALKSKRLQRLLENRRGYLAYFRRSNPEIR